MCSSTVNWFLFNYSTRRDWCQKVNFICSSIYQLSTLQLSKDIRQNISGVTKFIFQFNQLKLQFLDNLLHIIQISGIEQKDMEQKLIVLDLVCGYIYIYIYILDIVKPIWNYLLYLTFKQFCSQLYIVHLEIKKYPRRLRYQKNGEVFPRFE